MTSRAHTVVELVPYDEAWPVRFAAVADELREVLPDAVIEHVGSTSVPGLSSKDTIDIAVGVHDVSAVLTPRIEGQLRQKGFVHVPGSFADDPDHAFFARIVGDHRTDHLHVVPRDSSTLDEYLLFRDFLRAVPEAAVRYEDAKQSLARKYAGRRHSYVEEKLSIVDDLMNEARSWRRRAGAPDHHLAP